MYTRGMEKATNAAPYAKLRVDFRLTRTCLDLADSIGAELGYSRTAVIETAVRELAEKWIRHRRRLMKQGRNYPPFSRLRSDMAIARKHAK